MRRSAVKAFYAPAPYGLIQGVRLVHALMESSYRVHVPAEHADKFSRLREVFGVDFAIGVQDAPELPAVAVSHREPRTSVGSLRRALIFPQAIPRHCRRLWARDRHVRFSFAGLITENRRDMFEYWVRRAFPGVRIALNDRLIDRLKARARRVFRMSKGPVTTKFGDLVVSSSDRGREFPGKSWDEEYHALLARSQFVLCPSGDFVWSYRFFEAALCGAMPIVQQVCPAYDGFCFRTMDDSVANLQWNQKDAEQNFALCVERLTVPTAELNTEIDFLLTGARTS